MVTLILIGLLGGLITGVSPCVLPILPIIFFAGAAGKSRSAENSTVDLGADSSSDAGAPIAGTASADETVDLEDLAAEHEEKQRRFIDGRPLKIIAGVIVSFTVFTLAGSLLIAALNLPDDILRYIGVGALVIVGIGLIFPKVDELIQRPFYRLPKVQGKLHGNAFVFGLGMGTLYVPCAGPVLAAITVAGATGKVGPGTVALTISFAVGAAIPLFFFAAAGEKIRDRVSSYRTKARALHIAGGVTMVAIAVALALGATDAIQRSVPNYTATIQDKVENSDRAQGALSGLTNSTNTELSKCTPGADKLQSCGQAPPIAGISKWLNTPNGASVSLSAQKGKVVLIDFWAYSCINCQRSVPHVVAWDKAYRAAGLQVIGVHAPEFAFEKSTRNLTSAVKKLGITYPVAQDNDLDTWNNYRNRYWPAEYLIDSSGTVRHIKFGEGDYDQTEGLIRQLLTAANPSVSLPKPTELADTAPKAGSGVTPETYFGSARSSTFRGNPALRTGATQTFTMPGTQDADTYSLSGRWKVSDQYIAASAGSSLRLAYHAKNVYLVLAGEGSVQVSEPGQPTRTVSISGVPTLHQVVQNSANRTGQITVTPTPGIQFYTATFG